MSANVTFSPTADGIFDDWFELYNPNSTAIALGGYTLTDNFTNTLRWSIPTGTVIAPHGYLLVWSDDDTNQTVRPTR